ncbi:acid phosphatase det1, partial [Quaeritorhiza haematococci]
MHTSHNRFHPQNQNLKKSIAASVMMVDKDSLANDIGDDGGRPCIVKRPQNILNLLRNREIEKPRPNTNLTQARKTYCCIYPNHTVYNVTAPQCTIRKFTPDGQQHAVQLYSYNGPTWKPFETADAASALAWSQVFTLAYELVLTGGSEILCREFCLFTSDKKYVHDKRTFTNDYVYLAGHAGVQLRGNILAVISVQNQCIHMMQIKDSGEMVHVRTIGWHNHEDDELTLARYREAEEQYQAKKRASRSVTPPTSGRVSPFPRQIDPITLQKPSSTTNNLHSIAELTPPSGSTSSWSDSTHPSVTAPAARPSGSLDTTTPPTTGWMTGSQLAALMMMGPSAQMSNSVGNGGGASGINTAANNGLARFVAAANNQEATLSSADSEMQTDEDDEQSVPLSGLKQRLMAYLWRRAHASGSPQQIRHFFLTFGYFASLVMWRFQFLDDEHILIKFGPLDNVLGKVLTSRRKGLNTAFSIEKMHLTPPSSNNNFGIQAPEPTTILVAFFVMYNIKTTQVVGVYENTSPELLQMFESSDLFRGCPFIDDPVHFVSSPSNNEYAREVVRKQIYAVKKARNGGAAQAVRRVLSVLPINPQTYSDCPYYDHGLFSYDEKVINSCDRARPCLDFPIKFHARAAGELKFLIDPNPGVTTFLAPAEPVAGSTVSTSSSTIAGSQGRSSSASAGGSGAASAPQPPQPTSRIPVKRFAMYVFHPTDPFAITVQHSTSSPSFLVNFHARHSWAIGRDKFPHVPPATTSRTEVPPTLPGARISNRDDSNMPLPVRLTQIRSRIMALNQMRNNSRISSSSSNNPNNRGNPTQRATRTNVPHNTVTAADHVGSSSSSSSNGGSNGVSNSTTVATTATTANRGLQRVLFPTTLANFVGSLASAAATEVLRRQGSRRRRRDELSDDDGDDRFLQDLKQVAFKRSGLACDPRGVALTQDNAFLPLDNLCFGVAGLQKFQIGRSIVSPNPRTPKSARRGTNPLKPVAPVPQVVPATKTTQNQKKKQQTKSNSKAPPSTSSKSTLDSWLLKKPSIPNKSSDPNNTTSKQQQLDKNTAAPAKPSTIHRSAARNKENESTATEVKGKQKEIILDDSDDDVVIVGADEEDTNDVKMARGDHEIKSSPGKATAAKKASKSAAVTVEDGRSSSKGPKGAGSKTSTPKSPRSPAQSSTKGSSTKASWKHKAKGSLKGMVLATESKLLTPLSVNLQNGSQPSSRGSSSAGSSQATSPKSSSASPPTKSSQMRQMRLSFGPARGDAGPSEAGSKRSLELVQGNADSSKNPKKPRISDDLNPEILATSVDLPELQQILTRSSISDVTKLAQAAESAFENGSVDELLWTMKGTRLTINDAALLMQTVDFLRKFDSDLLQLNPDIKIDFAEVEQALYDSNFSTACEHISTIYSRILMVLHEVSDVESWTMDNVLVPCALAKYFHAISTINYPASIEASSIWELKLLAHAFSSLDWPSIPARIHVAALSHLLQGVAETDLFRSCLENIANAMSEMRREKSSRFARKREVEGAMEELQMEIADIDRMMTEIQEGSKGSADTGGDSSTESVQNSGEENAAESARRATNRIAAMQQAKSAKEEGEKRMNHLRNLERDARKKELQLAQKEKTLQEIEEEEAAWTPRYDALAHRVHGNGGICLGFDRTGRVYWWWELRSRNIPEDTTDKSSVESSRSATPESSTPEKVLPVYGILVEDLTHSFVPVETESPANGDISPATQSSVSDDMKTDPDGHSDTSSTNTPSSTLLKPDRQGWDVKIKRTWMFIETREQLVSLIRCLNDRGLRERDLRSRLMDKLRSLNVVLPSSIKGSHGFQPKINNQNSVVVDAKKAFDEALSRFSSWVGARGTKITTADDSDSAMEVEGDESSLETYRQLVHLALTTRLSAISASFNRIMGLMRDVEAQSTSRSGKVRRRDSQNADRDDDVEGPLFSEDDMVFEQAKSVVEEWVRGLIEKHRIFEKSEVYKPLFDEALLHRLNGGSGEEVGEGETNHGERRDNDLPVRTLSSLLSWCSDVMDQMMMAERVLDIANGTSSSLDSKDVEHETQQTSAAGGRTSKKRSAAAVALEKERGPKVRRSNRGHVRVSRSSFSTVATDDTDQDEMSLAEPSMQEDDESELPQEEDEGPRRSSSSSTKGRVLRSQRKRSSVGSTLSRDSEAEVGSVRETRSVRTRLQRMVTDATENDQRPQTRSRRSTRRSKPDEEDVRADEENAEAEEEHIDNAGDVDNDHDGDNDGDNENEDYDDEEEEENDSQQEEEEEKEDEDEEDARVQRRSSRRSAGSITPGARGPDRRISMEVVVESRKRSLRPRKVSTDSFGQKEETEEDSQDSEVPVQK